MADTVSGQPPAEFARIAESWQPAATTASGRVQEWQVAAFAALIGADAPGTDEPLPLLWHETQLRDTPGLADLGPDGHPAAGLLPPLSQRRRMFGGGTVDVIEALRVGERASRVGRVVDRRLREGRAGWLLLVTEEYEWRGADGEVRVRDRRDLVYRAPSDIAAAAASGPSTAAKAAESKAAEPKAAEPAPSGRWTLTMDTDERLLFMYSALTYNTHRIHYDAPYAGAEEGYPGLLVQGPLIATGCAEVARRHLGPVTSMTYRLVAPSFCGAPLTFHAAEPVDGVSEVWAVQHDKICARGTARVAASDESSAGKGSHA